MRTILLPILLTGLISGCALNQPDPWEELEMASVEATRPVPLPNLDQDLKNLEDVLNVAIENTNIAESNAAALEEQSKAYNALVSAGRIEHEIAEMRLRALSEERRSRMWERIIYWPLVVILGVAAVN